MTESTKAYSIVMVQPETYIVGGVPIQGYRVRAKWNAYNETVDINVPSLDKDAVNNALLALLKQRIDLDSLGHAEGLNL